MARTACTITDATRLGVNLAGFSPDAVNGNYLDNPERCIIGAYNPTGSPITLTLQYDGTWDGLAVAGRTVSIGAGSSVILGNFAPGPHYQDADAGRLYFNSSSASLNMWAVRFPMGS